MEEAKIISENDDDFFDEKMEALEKQIAYHNDYDNFWKLVISYIEEAMG